MRRPHAMKAQRDGLLRVLLEPTTLLLLLQVVVAVVVAVMASIGACSIFYCIKFDVAKRSHLERCFNLLLLLLLSLLLFLLFLFNIYYTLPRNGSFSTRGVAKGDNNYCGLLELPYGIRQSENNNNKQQQQQNTPATHVDRSFALSPSLTLLLSLGSHSIARETK